MGLHQRIKMDAIDTLRRCPLFQELDDAQLAMISDQCLPEIFESQEIVAGEGTTVDKLYIVEDGLALITLETGSFGQYHLQYISRSGVAGWPALLPIGFKTKVKAVDETRTLALDGKWLDDLCLANPDIGCRVYRGLAVMMARRLRLAYHHLIGVASQIQLTAAFVA